MAKEQNTQFQDVVSHCKKLGFIYQSSEIYGGLSAVYDYGPYGILLKNNIKEYWWKSMVQMHENIVGLDASIFMDPRVWKASGHVDAFNDPLVDNKDSKKRYRADTLIEDYIQNKIQKKIDKDVAKAAKRFGDAFDKAEFLATNPRIIERQKKIDEIMNRMNTALNSGDLADVKQLIIDLEIACPISGSREWTDVRQFNLMFSTQGGGATSDDVLYLRPETAQGIFVNFLNVLNTSRQKIPFGIAQIGKAFRNEIVARQFIFRMREFEQMEMQFFVRPGQQKEFYAYWKEARMKWHLALGTSPDKLRYHDHETLAHYADAALDIEFEFPFGFKELEGVHSRTDFDLNAHQELSGKKLQYFDPELKESYVPYVVETSVGCDRMFLAMMSNAYQVDQVPDANGNLKDRTVLRLHPAIAPIKCAVLPVVKTNEALTTKARAIFNEIKYSFECQYDEKDTVGRRYRRQDQLGTPYCITIDEQTVEDNTVTIRERDSMEQERIHVSAIEQKIGERVDMRNLLKQL
ncbi:glycine--tRNA ligase [Aureispira anguillae]|uniref:Glycine--tRNA ligase n=1 Tax=Aureispira anguillae TaxID=2864201 RepID=A0A915YK15_9BACT|nr:glycine--tRNA ligase [Aureispira anguillae]BDS14653.1 glycine--tRNA ligase [Aureispira anguillae]